MEHVSSDSFPCTPGSEHGRFVGSSRSFAQLVMSGSLLQLVTFGFYRFWLKTDIRRYLWSGTRIGEDALEYTGTARELLLGFLVAIAILLPLNILYFLLSIEAAHLHAFANLLVVPVYYMLYAYASFRARRYRVTRTVFRGVRFWMTGSAWGYAVRTILWDVATILTAGLAYPWRTAALERYKMANTWFGDLQGSFAGTGRTLFKQGWWLWLLAIGALIAATVVGVVQISAKRPLTAGLVLGLGPLVVLGLLYPVFRALTLRWHLDGIRFGSVSVASTLRRHQVVGRYALAAIGFAGFAMLAWQLVRPVLHVLHTPPLHVVLKTASPAAHPETYIALGVFYLVPLLGLNAIKLIVVDQGIWAAAANTLSFKNLNALDGVSQKGRPAGSLGEGFADALDLGAF